MLFPGLAEDPSEELRVTKAEGNEAFGNREYKRAAECYSHCLFLTEEPELAKAHADTRKAAFANRAACALHESDWLGCIADCTEALNLDAGYAKARLRRAAAYEGACDARSARDDLRVLLGQSAVPESVARQAKERLLLLRAELEEEDQEQALSFEDAVKSSGPADLSHLVSAEDFLRRIPTEEEMGLGAGSAALDAALAEGMRKLESPGAGGAEGGAAAEGGADTDAE